MIDRTLANAVTALLPEAVIKRRVTHDWHSATFSGHRLVFELASMCGAAAIDEFARTISEHEFVLPGLLVADIALTKRCAMPDGSTRLVLEALVLDDEI